jgi:RHS repeat-associated protein
LKYQDSGNPSSYFNGNIWQTGWRNSGDIARNYIFSYDGINRLESAVYSDGAANGHFNTAYTYDANGNISTLSRKANNVEIDALTYTYLNDGNRLYAVADNGTSAGYPIVAGGNYYQYDLNGNMTDDPSVGTSLSVDYNYLNLPKTVTFDLVDYVRYTYDAAGNKLVKAIDLDGNPNIGRFDYSGNFLYENGELKAIFTSAGRIIPFDNGGNIVYKFEYNLQDHLGNTRVVFSGHSNGQPELMQVTDYYPFGMVMNQQNYFASGVLSNKYLYNNKELQDDELAGNSLGWYDYGARFYDPALGRFHTVDAFAEKYANMSPYQYAANNPVLFIDVNGDSIDVSGLTERQLEVYNSQIGLLMKSEIFAAYYNVLSESETVYTISAQKGEEGTPSEAGQFFNPKTNEVGIGENMNAYAVGQELFHAYQHDGGFYSEDKPKPLSTIETEGDVVSIYVMTEAGLPYPSYGNWSQDFQFDAFDGTPSLERVQSAGYQQMFQTAVDNRINYYKSTGLNAPTYTSPNRGIGPKALEGVVRLIKK